jgi:hypothetical protein
MVLSSFSTAVLIRSATLKAKLDPRPLPARSVVIPIARPKPANALTLGKHKLQRTATINGCRDHGYLPKDAFNMISSLVAEFNA